MIKIFAVTYYNRYDSKLQFHNVDIVKKTES